MPTIDKETAIQFDKSINLALRYLFIAGNDVRGRIDPKYSQIFDRAIARASGELDGSVLELVYRAHPDLRPDFLGGTKAPHDFESDE
ncbi:hypothetical protein SAMN05216304_108213 [Bosea sp. OK403]|uniref:hypothetical protein n=1 Tax=Bosea sp. OK403 TaxID=1855286 RepID=UPI0008F06D70|nr:hypothetical protein [Bosea sp. OK403]SFJ48141.1 hypothetical protein SAMN05216304_108213 [Bosea sp. OK403]